MITVAIADVLCLVWAEQLLYILVLNAARKIIESEIIFFGNEKVANFLFDLFPKISYTTITNQILNSKNMAKTYQYTVHFEQAPDGVIIATVPALRGCVSYGQTVDEAEKNIREAIECYLAGLRDIGEEIPVEEQPVSISITKALSISLSAV